MSSLVKRVLRAFPHALAMLRGERCTKQCRLLRSENDTQFLPLTEDELHRYGHIAPNMKKAVIAGYEMLTWGSLDENGDFVAHYSLPRPKG